MCARAGPAAGLRGAGFPAAAAAAGLGFLQAAARALGRLAAAALPQAAGRLLQAGGGLVSCEEEAAAAV